MSVGAATQRSGTDRPRSMPSGAFRDREGPRSVNSSARERCSRKPFDLGNRRPFRRRSPRGVPQIPRGSRESPTRTFVSRDFRKLVPWAGSPNKTGPVLAIEWAPVLGRYAERLHDRAGAVHHVVSPLGAWMVVALCTPAAREDSDTEALAPVLRVDLDAAFDLAVARLVDPHPLVATAARQVID